MNPASDQPLVPRLYSFAAAACTALLLFLGMPGHPGWWPLLFVAIVPILLMVPKLPPRRAACMGMFCGLLYNISLVYWIVIVLGKYGGLSSWIAVPGMTLLALYMAGYFAFFCLLLSFSGGKLASTQSSVFWRYLVFGPICWVGLEYLRGVLLTGFPWMDLGYGLYRQPVLIQATDLGGHHLITFCLILVNGLVAGVINKIFTDSSRIKTGYLPVVVCIFLLVVSGYSIKRYTYFSAATAMADKGVVSAIQGNIAQDQKWTPAHKKETVETYISLSEKVVQKNDTDLIIWPETALPFIPQQDSLMGKVIDFVRAGNVMLLTGAPYFELHAQGENGHKNVKLFNSALLVNSEGRLAGRYDKQHLVPFGEYVPLRSYLPFLEPLVVSVGDFTAGSSFSSVRTGKIKAGVLICFESIFPDIARKEVSLGSNLLVNITNDAWYGRTSAPYQSFAMAVFRAVENRRSLVRAANTGLSGFVDPVGKVHFLTPLFSRAAITAPVALLQEKTLFTSGGHWFGALCLILMPLILLWGRKR